MNQNPEPLFTRRAVGWGCECGFHNIGTEEIPYYFENEESDRHAEKTMRGPFITEHDLLHSSRSGGGGGTFHRFTGGLSRR